MTTMKSCHSNLADSITAQLTAEEVVRRYGFEPSRSGFIPCPFHQGDHNASLKLYADDRGWFCFGCRRGGSVVNFVMELFGVSFAQALIRLNSDFGLGLTPSRPTPKIRSFILEQRRKEKEELESCKSELRQLCKEFGYWFEAKKLFSPTSPQFFHPLYAEAVKRLDVLDYMIEEKEGEIKERWEKN